MLTEKDIKDFYGSHNLTYDTVINRFDYIVVLTDAFEKDNTFGLFVRESFMPLTNDTFKLNFDDWEDLLGSYYSFVAGYLGNKSQDKQC